MQAYLTSSPAAAGAGTGFRTALAGLVMGALVGSAEPSFAATSGTCQPAKVKFVAEPVTRNTTSGFFTNVAGTTVNFTQGGASNSCVLVYFFADVAATENTVMNIRATLDGVANAIPTHRQFFYDNLLLLTRSASFIFTSVAPGPHTIRIQYQSNPGGKKVYVSNSNVIVHFAPP